jgi:glycosyltransferase involved in cell wall biosynthesis
MTTGKPSQAHISHCVIVPSYNSGPLAEKTVREVLAVWQPVIVIIDGSTDGSEKAIAELARNEPSLHMIVRKENTGKGGAVLAGLDFAAEQGWTHAAVFDADGQHEASDILRFMDVSGRNPEAMILGVPVFAEDAPSIRVKGRLAGNWWANLETWWGGIHDSLFGFRVYPVQPLIRILRGIRGGRRFDFDTQVAVRLYWLGIRPLNLRTRVHYQSSEAGGVSHFHYVRDNLLLVAVHARLFLLSLTMVPRLIRYRRRPALHTS